MDSLKRRLQKAFQKVKSKYPSNTNTTEKDDEKSEPEQSTSGLRTPTKYNTSYQGDSYRAQTPDTNTISGSGSSTTCAATPRPDCADSIQAPAPSASASPLPAPVPAHRVKSAFGRGDSLPIHYQSRFVPIIHNCCWTINDFVTAASLPKLLKSYRLELKDCLPHVEFLLRKCKKSENLYLKVKVKDDKDKSYQNTFVKFGFSVGPHETLGEDFSLESPLMLVKEVNKARLNILDSKRLIHSYLVDGNLNLIVRFIVHLAITQPLSCGGRSSRTLIKNCSQFTLPDAEAQRSSQTQNQNETMENGNEALNDDQDDETWSYVYNSDPVKNYRSMKNAYNARNHRPDGLKVTSLPRMIPSPSSAPAPAKSPKQPSRFKLKKGYTGAVTGDFVRIKGEIEKYFPGLEQTEDRDEMERSRKSHILSKWRNGCDCEECTGVNAYAVNANGDTQNQNQMKLGEGDGDGQAAAAPMPEQTPAQMQKEAVEAGWINIVEPRSAPGQGQAGAGAGWISEKKAGNCSDSGNSDTDTAGGSDASPRKKSQTKREYLSQRKITAPLAPQQTQYKDPRWWFLGHNHGY